VKNIIDRIDPSLRSYIEEISPPSFSKLDIQAIAERARDLPLLAEFEQDERVDIHNEVISEDDLSIRIYLPKAAEGPLPVFLFIYGGGFFSGSMSRNEFFCQDIVINCSCAVIMVEYRKAPENPFPAGFDDCYNTFKWVAESPRFESDKIIVGGMSAGAALAAAIAIKARDKAGTAIKGQILISPCLDNRFITKSSTCIQDPRVWHEPVARRAWDAYLVNYPHETPVYASPSHGVNYMNLPPTLVTVEAVDILRDEGIEYATNLMNADIDVELHVFPGAFHGSLMAVPEAEVSKRHFSLIHQYINTIFHSALD